MIKKLVLPFLFFLFINSFISAQDGVRRHFNIPDIDGFHTLKADLHIHTVFSDGLVWPTLRPVEAWTEGLDVISITDHIEYRPFSKDVVGDHNRSYELALPKAAELGIILIKGTEITRKMPPGHSNALFVKDINQIDTPEWKDAFAEAGKQGAFIFWNHPGWKAQQRDTVKWFDEHTGLLASKQMHGIEIVNYKEYYPEAFKWALEKNLTILANSDIHGSVYQEYDLSGSGHRPMTLIFTRERSEKGVKDALFERRTVALFNGTYYGREEWMSKLFKACVGINADPLTSGEKSRSVEITNYSSIDLFLVPGKEAEKAGMIYRIELPAHSTIKLTAGGWGSEIAVKPGQQFGFMVENMFVAPDQKLKVNIRF